MFFQISYYYTECLTGWRCLHWQPGQRCLKDHGPVHPPLFVMLLFSGTDTPGCTNKDGKTKKISLPYRVPVLLTGWPHAIRLKCSSLGPSLTCGHLLRPIPSFPVWFLYKTSPKALNGIIKWISSLWSCQAHHVRNISTYLLFKTSVY